MQRKHAPARRSLPLLVVVAVLGAVALLAGGCSSSSAPKHTPQAQKSSFAAEGLLTPVRAAPALTLRNYLGQRVDLASYKGKAVFITFVYTHCPDVCPLIVSNLRVAQNLMSRASAAKAEVIAVSVDPRGDTRKAVTAFLAHHEMTGRMQYLVGSQNELERVWQAWGVSSERDKQKPEFLEHSGLIYGITGSGKRLTIYAANFQPSDVAHDAPLLAAR